MVKAKFRVLELNANISNNKLGSPTCCSRKGYDLDRSRTCHVNVTPLGFPPAFLELPGFHPQVPAEAEPFRIAAVVQKGMRQKVQLKAQTQQSPVLAVASTWLSSKGSVGSWHLGVQPPA